MLSRLTALLLVTALLPAAAIAQTLPDGSWTLTLTPPPGMSIPPMPVEARTVQDSLRLAVAMPDGTLPMEKVTLQGEALHFVIPTDHARIRCDVYRQNEDTFTGACEGPMGEFPARLTRDATDES